MFWWANAAVAFCRFAVEGKLSGSEFLSVTVTVGNFVELNQKSRVLFYIFLVYYIIIPEYDNREREIGRYK